MIFLVTPTGARLAQFSLCARWMKHQTYKGAVVWIIVDDASPRTTEGVNADFRSGWTIVKIYPTPTWRPGRNTQARNIKAATDYIKKNYPRGLVDAIFIIEDDDYYTPAYLDEMMKRFNGYDAIGEIRTIYYNVVYRRFIANANTVHSSLFQTAISYDGIAALEQSLGDRFIDARFWKIVKNKYLFHAGNLSIGIKGMAGRTGIGAGHQKTYSMNDDRRLTYLTKLIGQEDAKIYGEYHGNRYRDNSQLRRPLFVKKRR